MAENTIPNDPMILLSFVNTKLRDFYPSLDKMCDDLGCSKEEIESKLSAIDYKYNAELNHVDNMQVMFGDASVLTHVSGLFDVIMANINRNILLNDMEAFKEVMASNAHLIISGFYESDIPLLLDKATALGFTETGRKKQEDWCCLMLQLKA